MSSVTYRIPNDVASRLAEHVSSVVTLDKVPFIVESVEPCDESVSVLTLVPVQVALGGPGGQRITTVIAPKGHSIALPIDDYHYALYLPTSRPHFFQFDQICSEDEVTFV